MRKTLAKVKQIDAMGPQISLVVLLFLCVGVKVAFVSGWSYEPAEDQSTWADTYPSCSGERQSPIDLQDFTPTDRPMMTWLGFKKVPDTMTLTNTGHSATLRSTGVQPRVKLCNGKIFQLDSVHFHWGKKNSEGSDHALCGVRYPLEMHAVHKRVFANGTAVGPVEYIVLTTLFQNTRSRRGQTEGTEAPPCAIKAPEPAQADSGLNRFIQQFPLIEQYNSNTSVPAFAWSKLIPKFTEDFYWYEGSFTSPPCSEVVTFFVNRQLRWVSNAQMMFFRLLMNEEDELIAGNFREVLQPRNGRKVYFVAGDSE